MRDLNIGQPFSLAGQVVLVTGAASGIGRAIAAQVLALGGSVLAFDRDGPTLDVLAQEQRDAAARLAICAGSVSVDADNERAVQLALARFGRLDGLVNNAAVVAPAMLHKMTQEAWDQVIATDLTGPYKLLQTCARHWIATHVQNPGQSAAIVNIASEAARNGVIGQINYAAAKAGLLGVTISAARELARYGVRSNAVSFGLVDTPMTQLVMDDPVKRDRILAGIVLGRVATPAEVAAPVCFMLSPAARYVTGQILGANGGAYISI